jgi:outer membrane immunogenic protein
VPVTIGPSAIYAWSGLNVNNAYLGRFVGGIGAFNGNLNSEGWIYRLEAAGGNYKWDTTTLPNTRIDTYNGAAMLGFRKAVGPAWLSTYIGAAFETHDNPDVPSPTTLNGTKGGAKALVEYWTPLQANSEFYGSVSYATPFSTTNAYGRLSTKLTDKISIGPETGYFANDVYRDVRVGGFISFKTTFGEIAFSGGYRDPLTPGPSGYYANVYLGFEHGGGAPAAGTSTGGLAYKAPPPLTFNWTGFYIGGNAGGAWSRLKTTDVDGFAALAPAGTVTTMPSAGFTGGGQAGYNWQSGNWLVGIEGDIGWLDIGKKGLINGTASNTMIGIDSGTYADITGRVGFITNNALFYGKAGWAFFNGDRLFSTTAAFTANNDLGNFSGWTLATGGEWLIAPNWTLKFELQHFDFGTRTFTLAPPTFAFNEKLKVDVAKVGLNYFFGSYGGKGPVVAKY